MSGSLRQKQKLRISALAELEVSTESEELGVLQVMNKSISFGRHEACSKTVHLCILHLPVGTKGEVCNISNTKRLLYLLFKVADSLSNKCFISNCKSFVNSVFAPGIQICKDLQFCLYSPKAIHSHSMWVGTSCQGSLYS